MPETDTSRKGPLFHGGVTGLRPGDEILPGHAEHRYVPGCPHCEAQRAGLQGLIDPPTPKEWVYATESRPYARFYASRVVNGDLYRVFLVGDIERSREDLHFPSWRGRKAIVHSVLERHIILTMKERRRLFLDWGGTDREFQAMIAGVAA